MSKFAADTSVSVSASKAEIERIVERYGASQFMSGWDADRVMLAFTMNDRQVRFIVQMPDRTLRQFTHHSRGARTPEAALKEWEQACRQRWRALALVIKAKLEAVESGISTFEEEFLASIVLPSGKTVGQEAGPAIERAYNTGAVVPLLTGY